LKLSIIIPVYNDPRVGRALDSILSQKHHAELELIVIDGGSTRATLDILDKYRSHISVLVSEPDRGIYDAMNKGIQHATGDVAGILNADDQYHDDLVLRDILEVFREPEVDACYGDLIYVDHNGRAVRYWRSGAYHPNKFYLGWMPPHPTFFVRRQVYDLYGAFDTRYSIAGDYELMLRLILKHRIRLRYLARVLVQMSVGGDSNRSIRQIVKANYEVFRAWENNSLRFGYLVPVLKPVQKLFQYFARPSQAT